MMFIRTQHFKCRCKINFDLKIMNNVYLFKKGHIYEFYKDDYGYRFLINDEWNWCLDDIHFHNLFEVIDNG